jgi:hypothetical protein
MAVEQLTVRIILLRWSLLFAVKYLKEPRYQITEKYSLSYPRNKNTFEISRPKLQHILNVLRMGSWGSLPRGQRGRNVKLTNHLHLVPRPKIHRITPKLPHMHSQGKRCLYILL